MQREPTGRAIIVIVIERVIEREEKEREMKRDREKKETYEKRETHEKRETREESEGATPTTSPSPSQVMSPTTRSPTSSSTPRIPSSTLPLRQTTTWMTRTLGKLLAEVHRDYADYRCPEGVSHGRSNGATCEKK